MKIQTILYICLALITSVQASDISTNLLGNITRLEKSISQAGSLLNENDLNNVSYSHIKKLCFHYVNTLEALKAVKEINTNDPLRNCLTDLIEEMCKDPYLKRCLTEDSSMTRVGVLNRIVCSRGQNSPKHYQRAMSILMSCGKEFITYTTLNKTNIDQAAQEGEIEAYLSTEEKRLHQIGHLLNETMQRHPQYGDEEKY